MPTLLGCRHILWTTQQALFNSFSMDRATPLERIVNEKGIRFNCFMQASLLKIRSTDVLLKTCVILIVSRAFEDAPQKFCILVKANATLFCWVPEHVVTLMTNVFAATDKADKHGIRAFVENFCYVL